MSKEKTQVPYHSFDDLQQKVDRQVEEIEKVVSGQDHQASEHHEKKPCCWGSCWLMGWIVKKRRKSKSRDKP
ncbi:hypothetical protein CJ231_11420 [Hoylesella buccalis]|uniref:Uncharacterized protein n=1 Tax=Hoylesella buccalis TaxID=28127 RepID=A0A2N6QNF4_9BACT|nr:hypothetical protein [Hoylesella buccalis]PMC23053.1 hypothetical protein CJ231_11420 [Hoylesella buccalis]